MRSVSGDAGPTDRVRDDVLRVAMTVRADAVEAVLDELVPLLPRGVHERDLGDGRAELAFHEHRDALPPRADLEAAAGAALLAWAEEEVPDDPRARRRRYGRGWTVAGRLRVRGPDDAPGDGALPELVIEAGGGAFGTGAHPTTRMCLELLLDLEPAGGFADLGCGAGVLAIAAAHLGWSPVLALDHEPQSVAATRRNAARNGVEVDALEADLVQIPPPPVPVLAANVPRALHAVLASRLPPATGTVIASGFSASERAAVEEAYAAAGLALAARRGDGWQALQLERRA